MPAASDKKQHYKTIAKTCYTANILYLALHLFYLILFIVGEFKAKSKYTLKLIPLEGNWDGAVEDEYFDDESPRYLALEVNE